MLSCWDDHPVHQIADVEGHVGSSDRNFYDRHFERRHGRVLFDTSRFAQTGC